MSMGMGLRPSLGLRQTLSQRQTLKMTQKYVLKQRLALLLILIQIKYDPSAKCPRCGKVLKEIEILQGFNRNVTDTTTKCPRCGNRFQPYLRGVVSPYATSELPFYCLTQVLHLLTDDKASLKPKVIEELNPAMYHSLIVHCGSLKAAFARNGVKYKFKERQNWKTKIKPFLGTMPDTVIADCVGVSSSTIRRMRKRFKIKSCREYEKS